MTEPTCWRRVPGLLRAAVTTLGLIASVALVALEEYWARPRPLDGATAFREGTIGTELAPLAVFEVLPDLFSDGTDYLQPLGPADGDWVDQFGLIRRPDSPLPVGMYLSHLRPQSGAGSPVPFVGLGCALCHSSEIRVTADGPAAVFVGTGTPHADVPGFAAHPIDEALKTEGATVYRADCFLCHGDTAPGGKWVPGTADWFGTIRDVGTDPERRRFRHREKIPQAVNDLYAHYPRPHPLAFEPDDVRSPAEPGYYCGPIGGSFVRSPYLHNGSVLTLAELIGLKPRRAVFYRGRNLYDPIDVGLASPEARDVRHHFEFRTEARGNSNAGHYYPEWAWEKGPDGGTRRRKLDADQTRRLRALLESLKTI